MLRTLLFTGLLIATNAFAETPTVVPTPARVVFPGALDPSFGVAGYAPAPSRPAAFTAVATQPDGRIVVVGNVFGTDTVVIRYDANGILDESFGDRGVVVPGAFAGGALAIAPDGDVIVVGSAGCCDVGVLRLHDDGTADESFAGGIATTDIGTFDTATAVLAQKNGRILVLAEANDAAVSAPLNGAVAVLAYRADGTLDPTFGKSGIARISGLPVDGFTARSPSTTRAA